MSLSVGGGEKEEKKNISADWNSEHLICYP